MTLFIVRHGVAGAKSTWRGDDAYRPLTSRGLAQAQLLESWLTEPISVVLSSPTVRCLATVLGVARHHGIELSTCAELAVGRPAQAQRLAERLLGGPNAVLCTHGEVIVPLLAGLGLQQANAPTDRCAKGAVWTIEAPGGRRIGTYHALDQAGPAA